MIQEKVLATATIRIFYDDMPTNPRDWRHFTNMVCFHGRYNLGDEHEYRHNRFSGWEEMKKAIMKDKKVHTILPLYLYDHSGITISTSPFSCKWDSGQIGWIYVTKADAKTYGITDVEKAIKDDVDLYDKYLRGEVYYYQILQNETIVETCGGFFDIDECMKTAEEQVEMYEKAEEVKQ